MYNEFFAIYLLHVYNVLQTEVNRLRSFCHHFRHSYLPFETCSLTLAVVNVLIQSKLLPLLFTFLDWYVRTSWTYVEDNISLKMRQEYCHKDLRRTRWGLLTGKVVQDRELDADKNIIDAAF